MFTLWTLYQALKLLERHAVFNQRCKNWVGGVITNGLIMGFPKQRGGAGGTSTHPLVLTFKFYKSPQPKQMAVAVVTAGTVLSCLFSVCSVADRKIWVSH